MLSGRAARLRLQLSPGFPNLFRARFCCEANGRENANVCSTGNFVCLPFVLDKLDRSLGVPENPRYEGTRLQNYLPSGICLNR